MSKRIGRVLLILVVFALVAAACSGDDGDADPQASDGDGDDASGTAGGTRIATSGPLTVRLSQGEAVGGEGIELTAAVVEGTELDAASIADVLDRLPEWVVDDADQRDFNRPAESLPPPRVGDTIDEAFPAGTDDPPPEVPSGPLEVLRMQPVGDVGLAPFMSLTFNQPMVPLSTVEQLDEADVPVVMTPELPGRWQWIGTRTLRFEHDPDVFDRLPQATSYVVEVPAGTTSESGGVLAEAVRWDFETPPPSVVWLSPQHESLPLEPVFLATFDQRIDADAVLGRIRFLADGEEREIRLATEAEIEADDDIAPRAEAALAGTWLAFRPVAALDPDTLIGIEIGPEVPSAEGPNLSEGVDRFSARTYAPLRVEGQSCERTNPCDPDQSLSVWFNNTLDPESIDGSDIEISPALPGSPRISVQWNEIVIRGTTEGTTVYEVTVPAALTDEFGQQLGDDTTVEFHVGSADPEIRPIERELVTVDPLSGEQTVPLTVRNHDQLRVRIFEVEPEDWSAYRSYVDLWWERYDEPIPEPPWPASFDDVIDTGAAPDERTEVRIDLEPVLDGEAGHAVMIVEGVGRYGDLQPEDDLWWRNRPTLAWVQSTDIGVDLITDYRDLAVWTTDLRTGEPLADVEIALGGGEGSLTTGADGLARSEVVNRFEHVVARLGADSAVLAAGASRSIPTDQTIFAVLDDRGMYRPGETMRVKGWVRNLDLSGDGAIEFIGSGEVITYTVHDSFGNELDAGELRPDEHGGFDFSVDLPAGANLGFASIELRRPADRDSGFHSHQFQIQEFRRPEFEVIARPESPGPYFVNEPATVAVDANYFSGGPLPDADVEWWVWTTPAQYSPPSWDDFTFGKWIPWWIFDDFGGGFEDVGFRGGASFVDDGFFPPPFVPEGEREHFTGVTDASGTHYLRMDFDGDGEGLPTTVTAESTVFDVNRQAWSSSTDLLVHPADLYVGLRATRTFVRAGDPLDVEAIVTDIDGNAVSGRIFEMTAERLVWEYVDGEWTEVAADTETCAETSGDAPVTCTFAMAEGGRYRIAAEVVDDAGRASRTEMTRWVSGGGDAVPNRSLELEDLTLIPDAEEYQDGQTAEILVDSPISSATGLVTVTHGTIEEIRTFEVEDHTAVIEIPITDDHVPELQVQVEIAGTRERTADDGTALPEVPDRPAFATGRVTLRVPPFSRTLDVSAEPATETVEPGADTSIEVSVADAGGAPVAGADVLVVVVDEAVLALSGYELIDPVEVFYRSVGGGVSVQRGRSSILLADPQELLDAIRDLEGTIPSTTTVGFGAGGDGDAGDDASADLAGPVPESARLAANFAQDDEGGSPIEVRQNFDALAVFDPDVTTGADGTATVEFRLPDNLTRYRVMAVAVDGADRFGTSESNLTARLPLQVRPSAPRFLNFGDDLELPIVVQNPTDDDMDVDLVLQTANLVIDGSAGRRVEVPANDRIEVRFPVRTESAGTARFRAAAVSADHADAAIVSLPVYTPATAEAFATYGTIDEGAVIQTLATPTGVFGQFGGLEVTTSSTAVQALTDAVFYLAEYPYRSADAYASRIIAITALRPVLDAFGIDDMPTPEEFEAILTDDIRELSALQNFDGGFGWWFRDQRSRPFQSIQAMHALVVASKEGNSVSPEVMANGRSYLRNIRDHIPADWSQEAKDMLEAYALHVRWLDGDSDAGAARDLWNRRGAELGLDALAWIWPIVADAAIEAQIERTFQNRVTETPAAATFATDYGEDAYLILHSDRRTDGIVLDALVAMAPESDLIPKVVNGLLANRIKGRWNNVQENSFILLALNNYFDTFESVDPDFVARVWLGDLYAAEHEYRGRSLDRSETLVPMEELLARGDEELILAKDGAGRLYYRLGLRYAPDDLDLDPLDRGFVVQRSYEAVDDPDDVRRDDDGVWHVKAGAEVRVRLTMVNDSRRTNMVLVDPLPAGLESLNPALAVTRDIPPEETPEDVGASWWFWTWYEHQNLRDDRAEAFSSYLWAGTHEYSYVTRATTPGTFVVPPARAEEIYAPEVFGRSGSDVVTVG